MKEQELKSAFEIEGFLEGKTGVQYTGCDRIYSIKNKKVVYEAFRGATINVADDDNVNVFFSPKWLPVPEPKPKMYRHTFKGAPCSFGGGDYRYVQTVETTMDWKTFKLTEYDELVSTEEI